jgi:hypothetical protein
VSDSLVIHLLYVMYRSTGADRTAARFLLRQLWNGVRVAADVDRMALQAAEEMGEEVGEAVRGICRDAGICD